MRRFIHSSVALAVSGLFLSVFAAGAAAAPISFAQFNETSGGTNSFVYTDNGPGQDAQLTAISVPVNFTYLYPAAILPLDLQGVQAATLTLTSSTTNPVQVGGVLALQPFDSSGALTDTLTITRDQPAGEGSGARTNLLTVSFTADLLGVLSGRTPQFAANSTTGQTVIDSSDFFVFSASAQRDFTITFSSWISNADGNGVELDSGGNHFNSATAAAAGTFDAVAAVPEPTPGVLALFAVVAFQTGRRVRRRRLAYMKIR